jgi:hypothetical protein
MTSGGISSNTTNTVVGARPRSGSQVSVSSADEIIKDIKEIKFNKIESDSEDDESESKSSSGKEDSGESDEESQAQRYGKAKGKGTPSSLHRTSSQGKGKASPAALASPSFYEGTLQPSLGSVLGNDSLTQNVSHSVNPTTATQNSLSPSEGMTQPVDIRQGIMSTIQEISEEVKSSLV